MNVFLRIDINLVAIILLGSVYWIAKKYLNTNENLNKAFLRVSLIVILELCLETGTCIINRRSGLWLIPMSNLMHICLYTTAPLLAFYGYVLIQKLALPYKKITRKRNFILGIPIIVNAILSVLSPIFHFLFYIDGSNIYHRGKLFIVFSIITYFYFLLSLLLIFLNKNKMNRKEFIPLTIYVFLPVLGGVVQTLFYGALLMWSSTAFALVVIYILLQQRMVQIDDLTGVWSRNSFDSYIVNRLKQCTDKNMGIIYCDIDGLKSINDKFGHKEGDYAISTSTSLIKQAIRKQDIIVRMGGDEFIILLECETKEILHKTIKKLEQSFAAYNQGNDREYDLGCSFGADFFNSNYSSIEQFLHHVDSLMYQNKRIKKIK